eukprot:gnl/Spiro4/2309_TR1111_c0_g1_i1.p2 gnl/Spiro4/2309_TR1111_c0_g1~~gnl/Spiro4/2309_TR1111_c0_g1_i1.p2  ORF type:complete len:189 (-),score=28.45 gnl/Spiro4/2309_TR1111_c0_g1_i1:48-614(-)
MKGTLFLCVLILIFCAFGVSAQESAADFEKLFGMQPSVPPLPASQLQRFNSTARSWCMKDGVHLGAALLGPNAIKFADGVNRIVQIAGISKLPAPTDWMRLVVLTEALQAQCADAALAPDPFHQSKKNLHRLFYWIGRDTGRPPRMSDMGLAVFGKGVWRPSPVAGMPSDSCFERFSAITRQQWTLQY